MNFDAALHFDNPEYADITITYSGRKTYCHKLILCTTSEYFRKMCGPQSSFAESKQSTIELKDDHPDAMYQLLRYLYTNDTYYGDDRDWDYMLQLEIAKVAQKYLCKLLHTLATETLREILNDLRDPVEVFAAVCHVRENCDGDEKFLTIAKELEAKHFVALLDVDGFRERLGEDKELMWQRLDEYASFKAGLKEMKMVWCEDCGGGRVHDSDAALVVGPVVSSFSMHKMARMRCWISKDADEDELGRFNLGGYSCL